MAEASLTPEHHAEGDVHFWKTGGIGDSIIKSDLGLGHESSGVVIKTGSNVKRLKIGDRVALECGIPCSKPTCEACRTGRYNGCPDIIFYSSPPIHGTLRRYHVHPEAWLHLLPDSISYEEGALLEPLSVALAGIERSGLRLGDPLVICGAGPIGMVSLLAAHAAGAAPIVITDLDENRLAMAKRLVPRVRTVQIQRDADARANAEMIKAALGQEAKLVIECTGVESSIHTGVYVCILYTTLTTFSSADGITGFLLRRLGVRDWSRERLPESAVHARIFPGDRHSLSVPVQGDISQRDHVSL